MRSNLTNNQRTFQYGKELGFQFLNLEQRANTSSLLKVTSFESVLNHFKAGYFSAALMIDRKEFVSDLEAFFQQPTWNPEFLLGLLEKYQPSPEMLYQRMTNLLPEDLGIKKLFFLRVIHAPVEGKFKVDKELHLHKTHHAHGTGLSEHYCRKWLSLSLLEDLQSNKQLELMAGAQRSHYFGTKDEYLMLSIARPAYPSPDKNVSVSLGLLIDKNLRENMTRETSN